MSRPLLGAVLIGYDETLALISSKHYSNPHDHKSMTTVLEIITLRPFKNYQTLPFTNLMLTKHMLPHMG